MDRQAELAAAYPWYEPHQRWLRGEEGGMRANLRDANLRGANLGGANLGGANLRDAYLRGANLGDAYLRDAYLRGANLRDAYLRGANLGDAYLRGANLRGANLGDAYLRGANLRGANLRGANLRGANLGDANLGDTDLRGATLPDGVPIIPCIDAAILDAIDAGGTLDMAYWHTCETTHCRAGWAITLAGDAGRALEDRYGPSTAGALIYAASRPDQRVPSFHASDDVAMADMRRCAEVQP